MKTCPSCGKIVDSSVTECNCGYRFLRNMNTNPSAIFTPTIDAAGKFCPMCGTRNPKEASTCVGCDHIFQDGRAPIPSSSHAFVNSGTSSHIGASYAVKHRSGLFANAGAKLMILCKIILILTILEAIALVIVGTAVATEIGGGEGGVIGFFIGIAAAAVWIVLSYLSLLVLIAFSELCVNVRDISLHITNNR
ncbi:MAG: hypothetical protein LUF89_11490 [Ruminococcus sp.]|nr:hypothetical protein [Ruminococcus sp.]